MLGGVLIEHFWSEGKPMKRMFSVAFIVARHSMCALITAALAMLLWITSCCSPRYESFCLPVGLIVGILSVVIFMGNIISIISFWLFKEEISRDTVLDVVSIFERIESMIPSRSIYMNRTRRPLLCFVLWAKQKVLKHLMDWLGIDSRGVIIIDKDELHRNVAGSVNIVRREIRIDSRVKSNHPESYLATLVHELVHIFAEQFDVHSSFVSGEERFTDALCVFLGLGDVMLNGCESSSLTEKWCGCYIERHYEHIHVGYLSSISLAIAEIFTHEITRQFRKVHKCYNSRSWSLLRNVRIWMAVKGIDYTNSNRTAPMQYLQRLRTQVELLEQKASKHHCT